MTWKVPFFDLHLEEDERQAVLSVIDSNWLTTGPKIVEFETAFTKALNEDVESVAVSSATAALHLSLLTLGIGPGDEVILPSLTFVACANVIRYVGAIPVFADVNSEHDWNISISDVSAKINSRTRAVMVVHYAGYSCDMDAYKKLCEERNLFLIEDCSHAPLGKWKGRSLGTFGDTGCFSFFSNKNMTTGEGGMVVSRSQEKAERIRRLRSHGITKSTFERFKGHANSYDVIELGYNYRMDEIRAAIGIEQLRKLPEYTTKRQLHTKKYQELIAQNIPRVKVPFTNNHTNSCYHIFPVLLPGSINVRNNVMNDMADRGIQCSIHYRPIHTFSSYGEFNAIVPITEKIACSILTLPLFPTLSEEQIINVIDVLNECLIKNERQ